MCRTESPGNVRAFLRASYLVDQRMERVMGTKHTPGPWSYWSGYNHVDKIEAQVTAEDGDIVIASYNHLIAEGEANAKLMAMSPQLLLALVDAVTIFRGLVDVMPVLRERVEAYDNLIAKATA